ncbi:MAG: AbrB/MazE/SpoVT family DNA-binding domain-containing protein [Oliverpabstia sp.]
MVAERNVMINRAGGNAGKDSKNYRISLPADMVRELGVTEDDRSVILKCDNGVITISKKQ